nr:hypothetical protein MIMGU_mgv1a019797mg [Ipomoea batatas]
MATWGAHPMTFPTPCVLSKNPSGRTSLGSMYSPGLREPFSGIRLSAHRNLCPLRSKAIAISFTCSSGKFSMGPTGYTGGEFGSSERVLIAWDSSSRKVFTITPFVPLISLDMVRNIAKPCSSSRAEGEAEHGGAGGVEHIGRNSKFVRHVNHGRGKHVDYESAQAYATDGFLNVFSDTRLVRVDGDHQRSRLGGIDGDRLVHGECHELQSPFRGLGFDERGDFEVERWFQDEDGDGDMVVSVDKELCDFNCG